MKKILRFVFLGIIAILVIGTFVFLWKKSQPEKVVYEIVNPSKQNIVKKSVATGKVEPRDEVLIKPQISGIITELYKEAGQRINEGEVIAKVKVIPEMNQLNNAQSNVRSTQINLTQSENEFNRIKKLYDSSVVSKEEYEKALTAYENAKESAQSAKDNLEIVTEGISKRSGEFNNTMVRSTISGMILDIPVKVGNSVILSNTFNDGTTIASVADMGNMIFKGNIDETEVGRIKEGMPITLTIGALQDKQFDAVLEYISPKGTETNGAILFEVKAAATIPDSVYVRAGYSANAEIILEKRDSVMALPESTIEISNDSSFVYVVTNDGKEPEFEKKFIKTGLSDGLNIEILDGITADTKVRGNKKSNK
ncbi:MAG: efflux RND transporter periplasmic adaptor subunit [Bacteroidales bacterium]|nr:efflux RND transporter periplasmic adaptor subunit [Bacteroidales bacterium]